MIIDKLKDKNTLHVIIYSMFIVLTSILLLFPILRVYWTPLLLLLIYIAVNFLYITKFEVDTKDVRKRYHLIHICVLILTIIFSFNFSYWYLSLIGFNFISLITSTDLEFKTEFKNIIINLTILVILGTFLFSVYFLIGGLFIIGLIVELHEDIMNDIDYKFLDLYFLGILLFSLMASLVNGWFIFLLLINLSFFKFEHYKNLSFLKTMFFNKTSVLYTTITYVLIFVFLVLLSVEIQILQKEGNSVIHTNYNVTQVRMIHGDYSLYGYPESGLPNTEHVFAQSWANINGEVLPYVHDLHNLYASDPVINNKRGNLVFGDDPDQYEPDDRWKGNIARVLLYMYITYPELRGLDKIDIPLMKEWSKLDPVDQGEKDRNQMIYLIDGTRNIFVDSPWMVNFVG